MNHIARALAVLALCIASCGAVLATEIYSEGEIIVSLNAGFSIEEVNATWGTTTVDEFPEGGLYLLYKDDVPDLEAFAEQMAMDPAVHEAESNYFEDTPEGIRQMVVVAVGGTYVDFEDQEITSRIGLQQAHLKSRGQGVTVAVLDTGIDPDHEVFQGRLAPGGFDFVMNDNEPWEEANGIDDDGDGLVDEGYGHGSMVAGIIALVAPEAKLLVIRVLDGEGRADAWTVTRAVRYAADNGADVINMSFGVPRTISTIGEQIRYAYDRGIPVIAGAGNENTDEHVYYPGAHSKVMLITALDSLDIKADFADWKSKVLVSAPGTGVRSAYPGGDWGLGSGCSFATPFVTGEVALILSLAPNMSNDDVEERVEYAVDPIYHLPPNEPYRGKLGTGRIYLPRALQGLASSAPPSLAVSRGAFAFPNPSRGSVSFHLPEVSGPVTALLCDVSGRVVRRIAAEGAGLEWDGRDAVGRRVESGVYFAVVRGLGREYRVPVSRVR